MSFVFPSILQLLGLLAVLVVGWKLQKLEERIAKLEKGQEKKP